MGKLELLSALDTARTQFYHYKAIIIAGMGLFTDAYDLFCIPPIMTLIGRIYYQDMSGSRRFETPPAIVSTMVAIALAGTAIGQLVFGGLGDRIGRRRVYGLCLLMMVLSSLACGFSICTTRGCVLSSLSFFRFMLGVGIGGDYPLSATIMSEFANKRTRGAFIAGVFSMQGLGILASSTVTMVVCAVFNRGASGGAGLSPDDPTSKDADLAWRIILMLGAVPAALTFYWRIMMPETARYTALVEQNVLRAVKDMEKVLPVSTGQIAEEDTSPPIPPPYKLFSWSFFRRHGRDLFACATAWFLVDIVFYSNNLFQSQVYKGQLKTNTKVNAYEEAYHLARFQAIVAACSTIPGYWVTVYYIDRIGRMRIQLLGFCMMALVYLAVGIPYYLYWDTHNNTFFLVLYGLIFFFANFGPNTTTFIVPAELFPARFRSTCHGISGAAGKVGAIIGSVGFLWASHNKREDGYPKGIGMTASSAILAGVCFAGMLVTYFFTTETIGRSLEDNENDSV